MAGGPQGMGRGAAESLPADRPPSPRAQADLQELFALAAETCPPEMQTEAEAMLRGLRLELDGEEEG